MEKKTGLIYVFEGDGKGKTSAAIGVAVRMLLLQKRVEWISWYKEKDWKTSEMRLLKVFKNNLNMHWMGKGFLGGPADHNTLVGHKKAAESALMLTRKILTKKEGSRGMVNLLVLDEVLRAVDDGLLNLREVIDVVKTRGETHVILTGHTCPDAIVEIADLITEMRKVKHPFDKGVLAVPGLDF